MDQVEEIKRRIEIVDFISQYLQLKKTGVNYSALCPFHTEKTPSFMVSPERQTFRCFGCSEGGDAITFLMKMEGLSFPEALKILGERVGVEVSLRPKEELQRERTRRDRLYQVNLLAAKYFKAILSGKQGKAALDYLTTRKLSREIIEKFRLGYAPDDDHLKRIFAKYKVSDSDLALAGHPERFRYRIMFPIFNPLSQVIGFSGRILESVLPKGVSAHPKYLNTPETPIFHKSKSLYGISLAKEAVRQTKRIVLVEGQMDVISSHQAGVEEVVAASGTALTREHLKSLSRYSSNIIFAFDEDEAGQKAALSAVQLAIEEGLDVKLTVIEGYKDVGELVEAEPKRWPQVIASALSPIEWLVFKAKKEAGGKIESAQDKKALAKKALPLVVRLQDEIEKAHYVSYLAKQLAVPEIKIEQSLEKIRLKSAQIKPETPAAKISESEIAISFLSFLFNYPELASDFSYNATAEFENKDLAEIYKQVSSCYNSKKEIGACLRKIKEGLPHELAEKLDISALDWDRNIAEDEKQAKSEFAAIRARFYQNRNEKIKLDYAKRISAAEAAGDVEKVKKLMIELQKVLGK